MIKSIQRLIAAAIPHVKEWASGTVTGYLIPCMIVVGVGAYLLGLFMGVAITALFLWG